MMQSTEKSESNAKKIQKNSKDFKNNIKNLATNNVETPLEFPLDVFPKVESDDHGHDDHDPTSKEVISNDDHVNTFEVLKNELLESAKIESKSKKRHYGFSDAAKDRDLLSNRNKVLVDAFNFINSNPLRNNDFYKYLNCYKSTGAKLDTKYFRHDLNELNELYERYDKRHYKAEFKDYNHFNINAFNSYVLFMFLKLEGHYLDSDDLTFNVKIVDSRIYNPCSKLPTILRSCLPFEVIEIDISKAFPTFIDIELNTNYRLNIYEKLSKKDFSSALNANNESKYSLEAARKTLSKVYKKDVERVLTDERYYNKGKVFKDLTVYEKKYIDLFVQENNLKNYVRLHDGLFIKSNVNTKDFKFIFDDIVTFAIKPQIKPQIKNNIKSFYKFENNKVVIEPTLCADFLIQEKFIKVKNVDDKLELIKNENNVIDSFNYKTGLVNFLESEICEFGDDLTAVKDKLVFDFNSVVLPSTHLLPLQEIDYYKDKKNSFGLPFANGFFYFEDNFEIKKDDYSSVNGYFAKHSIQKHDFIYTKEIGFFELFIQRIATGKKDNFNTDDLYLIKSFQKMLGYYCHNLKIPSETVCFVITDKGADDISRNGGRGKSLIAEAIKHVTTTLKQCDKEFKGDYNHALDKLNKSINFLVFDDVPAGFNYDDLYTKITNDVSINPKGKQSFTIDFNDMPKVMVNTNWLFRVKDNDYSTHRRFFELKLTDYYKQNFKVSDEFGHQFFKDWDANEFNKFYSYIFRCVCFFLAEGFEPIQYDKTEDNYKAEINDVKENELFRIFNVFDRNDSFNVNMFLDVYNSGPMKYEKLFHQNNAKNLINNFISFNKLPYSYDKSKKIWFKNT